MGFSATAGGGQAFRRVPTGVWVARCVDIIDLGTQEVEWQGQSKLQHKVQIGWEVFGEDEAGVPLTADVGGREMPLVISKRYTLSINDRAALRRDLEAWRGKPFDADELKGFNVSRLLGSYCLLNIAEEASDNGKTYSNIKSITPVPKGMPKPAGVHSLRKFDIDSPDMTMFEAFHGRLQEVILAAREWPKVAPKAAAAPAREVAMADMEDDIPF